jgi:hypothetical protein
MPRQYVLWLGLLLAQAIALGGPPDSKNPDSKKPDSEQSTAKGPNTKEKELAASIQKLIAQLDAPQVAARDEAEAALIKLGPAGLPHLPRITPRMSPETKARLGRVRGALELAYAQAAGRASLVTFSVDGMKLSQVIAAIEKQTGNKIVDRRPEDDRSDPVLKGKFDAVPFWKVLDDVLDQAGLAIDPHAADDEGNPIAGIAIVRRQGERTDRSRHVSYSGPLRIEAAMLASRRDLRSADSGQLKVTLNVAWEPQLSPVAMSLPSADIKAADEQGKPLAAQNEEANPEIPIVSGAKSIEVEVPLALPPRESKRLASLKGKLVLLTPGRNETFRFDKLAAAKKAKDDTEKSRGDVTVTLARVAENNDLWELRVQVHYGRTEGAIQSHYGWIYENRAHLEGPDGKPIQPAGFESDGIEGGIEATYYFSRKEGLDRCVFVYSTPSVLLNVPVEYELKDLPLP